MESQNFRWTIIELGTSCFIELIDPIGNEGFVQRFLDHRGDGVHHITIQVEDAKAMAKAFKDKGVPAFGFNENLPGWKEFFVHPKDAFGVLLQFAEFNPLDWINPGYVPKSYQEFVEKEDEQIHGQGKTEVHRLDEKGDRAVELTQGKVSIRVEQKDLPEMIRLLKTMLDD